MTRFARAKGSKASNEKLPEESTPWGELKKQILDKQNGTQENCDNVEEDVPESTEDTQEQAVWADLTDGKSNEDESEDQNFSDFLADDGTVASSANTSILLLNQSQNDEEDKTSSSNSSYLVSENGLKGSGISLEKHEVKSKFNSKKPIKNVILSRGEDLSYTMLLNGEETKIVNFEGFNIKAVDAERLYALRKKLYQEKKIPNSEVVRTIQLERRKAEKAFQREQKNVCYNCRQSGHYISDCPEYRERKNEASVETGICYKCGSTEHTSHECRLKHASFRFAKCFICGEQGHISRECPDNPRGIYPKGGACKGCGDVTHFAKDCPVLVKQKEHKPFTLGTLNNKEIEGLDDNFNFSNNSSQRKNPMKRKHSGMKSFYRQKRFKK